MTAELTPWMMVFDSPGASEPVALYFLDDTLTLSCTEAPSTVLIGPRQVGPGQFRTYIAPAAL